MSVQYSAIKWNQNKRNYDLIVAGGILLYVATFFAVSKWLRASDERLGDEVLLIRALGTCAFLMLHIVLCIGPLARLDRRFLPVLYNRRHLGVATFLVGLAHGTLTVGYYHGFGRLNPLLSVLTSNTEYGSWRAFPFESLGILALLILFVLASTSHDFWQKLLGGSVWKSLHMLVYLAYGLLVLHVLLGALSAERNPLYLFILVVGVLTVCGLQLWTSWIENRRDRANMGPSHFPEPSHFSADVWLDVGSLEEIPEHRAKVVVLRGRERIAVFRYGGKISAVTNVCAHQRGPLGEGRIVDGCITCPWHGWEYRPETGQSPPPFQERIATYRVRVEGRRILLNPEPLPPGTPVAPACFQEVIDAATCTN